MPHTYIHTKSKRISSTPTYTEAESTDLCQREQAADTQSPASGAAERALWRTKSAPVPLAAGWPPDCGPDIEFRDAAVVPKEDKRASQAAREGRERELSVRVAKQRERVERPTFDHALWPGIRRSGAEHMSGARR